MNNIFTDNKKSILTILIKYTGIYHDTYISQRKIAQLAGVHHDTVWRTLKLFHALGIIKKKYRGANRTCIYSLGKIFHDVNVKWALKDILPNLFWSITTTVSRCKLMLSGLIKPIAASFRTDTARLSNDKNKDLNTIKKRYEYTQKQEIKKPEIIVKQKIMEPDPDHDAHFNIFASILGISLEKK